MRSLLSRFRAFSKRLFAGAARSSHGHSHAHHHANGHHHFENAQAWSKLFDDSTRDAWQWPDEVVRALELDPEMTVAELGAGTGYFAVRLARSVARGRVMAIDVSPDMVRFMSERALRERLLNLEVRSSTPERSGLTADSVDRILMVHVWHHVAHRAALARDLANALKPGGRVLVVEFSLEGRRGPPVEARVSAETVIAEFTAAGLIASLKALPLPDQYVVEARKEPHPS